MGRASAEYTEAFWKAMRRRTLGVCKRPQVGETASGYLVPDEFERILLKP